MLLLVKHSSFSSIERLGVHSSDVGRMYRVRRRIAACRRHRLFEGGEKTGVHAGKICCKGLV